MKWNKIIGWLACAALVACNPSEPTVQKTGAHMARSAKRGVAFNFNYVSDLPLLSPYITWDYNWGNNTNENAALWFDANEIDYCPMCWNGNYSADKIRAYVAAHPNTKYLLGFNEPNLTDQANMTPAKAAELWSPVVALAKELNLKLVSPAMNYGTLAGYSDPIKWLDEFFAQPNVDINDVYAISVHSYMASPSAVQSFIERFRKYNKPVWVTEFCAWDPLPASAEVQMDYMCTVLHYMENEPLVERYAWFIPRYTNKNNDPHMQLITNEVPGELTDAGKVYCGFSSYDTQTYLTTEWIPAGSYCAAEGTAPNVRPNTDAQVEALELPLMIKNIGAGMTQEYRVCLQNQATAFHIRTAGYTDAMLRVYVDGNEVVTTTIARTGGMDNWATTSCPLAEAQQPVSGMHKVKLEWLSGSMLFSAFSLK